MLASDTSYTSQKTDGKAPPKPSGKETLDATILLAQSYTLKRVRLGHHDSSLLVSMSSPICTVASNSEYAALATTSAVVHLLPLKSGTEQTKGPCTFTFKFEDTQSFRRAAEIRESQTRNLQTSSTVPKTVRNDTFDDKPAEIACLCFHPSFPLLVVGYKGLSSPIGGTGSAAVPPYATCFVLSLPTLAVVHEFSFSGPAGSNSTSNYVSASGHSGSYPNEEVGTVWDVCWLGDYDLALCISFSRVTERRSIKIFRLRPSPAQPRLLNTISIVSPLIFSMTARPVLPSPLSKNDLPTHSRGNDNCLYLSTLDVDGTVRLYDSRLTHIHDALLTISIRDLGIAHLHAEKFVQMQWLDDQILVVLPERCRYVILVRIVSNAVTSVYRSSVLVREYSRIRS